MKCLFAYEIKCRAFLWLLIFSLLVCKLYSQKNAGLTIIQKEFIFENAPFPSSHSSTIAETPNGLIAAWFGGTYEKNKDVEIWMSRNESGRWTVPISVANGIQDSATRYPCWNPVLFQYPSGPLLLFYKVGIDPTSWWGEMVISNDNGRTWSKPTKLPQNILGPIKNKPVLLNNGNLVCASSTENKNGQWQVHLEMTNDLGKTWRSSPALNDTIQYHLIQPSLLIYPSHQLQLLCRSMENRIVSLWSKDDGTTWSAPTLLDMPNPNSGIDAVTLNNGLQLLVYNPTIRNKGEWGGPRSPLSVAISKDGIVWNDILVLEDEPGEFSYPAVIQSNDGIIHITYTWKREKIKHVALKIGEDIFTISKTMH